MVKVELKGIVKVKAKGRIYHYAWRGGPRLEGEPGSPSFMRSYNEAMENLCMPDKSRFRSLVVEYRASTAFTSLSASTKKRWAYTLDDVAEYFGELRVAQFDRPEKIRPEIRKWRQRFAATPRAADHHMQVLRRVLGHAVESSRIASNPCDGVKGLYTGDRSEIIWTASDVARLKASSNVNIGHAVDLAAHTELRLGDLLRLCWSHVGDDDQLTPPDLAREMATAIPRARLAVIADSGHLSTIECPQAVNKALVEWLSS